MQKRPFFCALTPEKTYDGSQSTVTASEKIGIKREEAIQPQKHEWHGNTN